jgi:hypothetical protein
MSLVRRHPLITYFVLTYALAWILWLPLVVLQDTIPAAPGLVLVLLGSNLPSLLAIVLTALVLGRGALRKLLGRLLIWRVDPRWYLVVVLGPVALAGGMIAFNAFVGGPCHQCRCAAAYSRNHASLLHLPRQCAGRGDRVARVRPAPLAIWKERSERQPHPRGDLGFLSPTAVLHRTSLLISQPLSPIRRLGPRSKRHPHLGVQQHWG